MRFIGHERMQCAAISFGVFGDCPDSHDLTCMDDAAGNFPAIGKQDFCWQRQVCFR